jgi:hypothetical protein
MWFVVRMGNKQNKDNKMSECVNEKANEQVNITNHHHQQ